jgi:hypothetical protein
MILLAGITAGAILGAGTTGLITRHLIRVARLTGYREGSHDLEDAHAEIDLLEQILRDRPAPEHAREDAAA